MVLSWLCFLQARARWMFAYHIPNGATCHTRKNVSYHLCCAAKWYKQKRLCGSVVPAWLYFCWAHFTLWASYPRCHMQKYARHGGRQRVLWGLYGYLMVSFLVSTLYALDPKCRMQKHARTLVRKNDIIRIGPRWSYCGFACGEQRGLFAYHIPKAATGNTRENVPYVPMQSVRPPTSGALYPVCLQVIAKANPTPASTLAFVIV